MPFKSEAQRRFMYATMPEKAKEWSAETPKSKDLPEKKHPSINPAGRKLSKKAAAGMFFRDHPGRDDGTFFAKTADDEGETDTGTENMEAAPPVDQEAGGGMYGTGKPKAAAKPTPRSDQKRLLELLDGAGPGKTRSAVKVASASPTDWESEANLPTGFHRPTKEQPEPLETGGDRYFSTLAKPTEAGALTTARHGLREGGSMHVSATSSPQLGKHASVRFFGTSFDKTGGIDDSTFSEEGAEKRLGEAGESLSDLGTNLVGKADKGIKAITNSPTAMGIAALLGGKALLRGGKSVARGTARMFGHNPAPKPGMIASGVGSLRKLVTGR